MRAHTQFCVLSFVHFFNGLAAISSFPATLVGTVACVVLVYSASANPLFRWHAQWSGGEFAARVSELNPSDGNMLRTTEASLARFRDAGDV